MELSAMEALFILETLEGARSEFEELVKEKEWYVTEVLDRIESSLQIITSKDVE